MSAPPLAAEAAVVRLGGRTILDGVSLAIRPGELLGIVGPNGSGKTTLVRALAGLQPLAGGRVALDGTGVERWQRHKLAARLAYLPQGHRIEWPVTVRRVVELGRIPHTRAWHRPTADDHRAVDTAIGPWLPLGWTRPADVHSITFRQLLTHTSGFGQNAPGGSDYLNLQVMAAQPVPGKGSFDYENANFGLLRVITAKLLGLDASALPFNAGALTSAAFLSYAQTVFDAAGVPFSCEPQGTNPTRQYDFPDSGNPGYAEPSRSLNCGGFGVQISATNLARTLAYLRYTQDLMPAAQFLAMKTGFLGFMNPTDYDYAQGVFGTYHTHGGDWDHTGSGGLDACVMVFPINVEAAVTINSSRKELGQGYPNGGYQCRVIKWAFENAWVAH